MNPHPNPADAPPEQGRAVSPEERAEIRALADGCAKAATYPVVDIESAIASTALRTAADALPRLLDSLEAAERERDRLAEANWKGSAALLGARDTLAMIAADSQPWHTCTHPEDAQRELDSIGDAA
jgi:hypothetical protein